ncbi:hypothetical protein [Lentibacillus salinarum]|uniref:hypothetical protein n=1 Tax=Lentibacillus salinarum TaxID=446820 RepID=UPI0036D2F02A
MSQYAKKKNHFNGNTTIDVDITNGKLTKANCHKVASMAHNGYARTIRPLIPWLMVILSLLWEPTRWKRI